MFPIDIDFSRLKEVLTYDPQAPMIFSSGIFLWLFAAFMIVYTLLQRKYTARILFVTLFSYYFYYKSSGTYFFLLALVTVCDFLLAQWMDRTEGRWKRKGLVTLSLGVNLGLLAYFKYTNFLGGVIASLMGGEFTALDIFLPVGISFFTFQSLSYTIDVYRKDIKPLTNILDYAFYVSFFPQLVAGPIVRARDFIPQIRKPLFVSQEMFGRGIFLILSGLFKKAIISDYISVNFVRIFDNPTLYSGLENLMGVYGYALQIYCDFSGYSDMAIGIALLLGFHFNLNFNSPYKSASITEFWRRWHISLTTWFRDYIYIPLGGSRAGKWKSFRNTLVIFLVSGFWHGANWTFVAWGAYHALLFLPLLLLGQNRRYRDSVAENSFLPSVKELTQMGATFLLVLLGWILFRSEDISQAAVYLERMFNVSLFSAPQLVGLGFGQLLLKKCFFFTALMFIVEWIGRKQAHGLMIEDLSLPVRYVIYTVLLIIIYGFDASNPQGFIYFQF